MTRHPQILQISIFMFIEPKLTFKFPKNDFGQKRLFKDIQLLKKHLADSVQFSNSQLSALTAVNVKTFY